MQQGGGMDSSYYHYYQPPPQNPNPNATSLSIDPQFNPTATAAYASAPPVSPGYSTSDYSNYSSTYPSYSPNPDHVPVPPPSYIQNTGSQTSHQPYTFPHLDLNSANYYQYDQNQSAINYDYSNPSYNPSFSSAPPSYSTPSYENSFEKNANYGAFGDQGLYDGGVYKYNEGKVEAYASGGSRGGGGRSESSSGVLFDDYGRPINIPSGKEQTGSGNFPRIVKAVPKIEEQQDVKSGVLKFRGKLLSEGIGQTDMDVLFQIGLDGIRIVDPATGRTQKIYPLENVTRWEVLDSYIFAFWAKSSVDIEPRRIRLKSNSYTTSNILDAVTAASIQVKEMGPSSKPSEPISAAEQAAEKKKGFADWMKLMKPQNEEKDHWVPDEAVTKCTACGGDFSAFNRRHHCRNCGDIFCDKCTQGRIALTVDENAQPVRVCDRCMAEVTQRLSSGRVSAVKVTGLQTHEALARKLQEEMDKNRKVSIGRSSDGNGTQMREVACPTCTVHLQVQVPTSGSETIECSVCQHPFLVKAH